MKDIIFKRTELEDKEIMTKYFDEHPSRSCERTFVNVFLWSRQYPVKWAIVEGAMVFKSEDEGHVAYAFPAGTDEHVKRALDKMKTYSEERGYPFRMYNVTPDDFGSSHPLAGMYFQRKLEEKAFELGGSDYSIPVQRVEDYLENKESKEKIETSLKRVKNANLNALLPEILNINLKEGLLLMNNKINGFTSDATLLGVESRSSAPIRFYRDDNMESNIKGIYPIGEGAGYAGGIMSSAIDGLKCSEVLLKGER